MRMMNIIRPAILLPALVAFSPGCSTTEETREERPTTEAPIPPVMKPVDPPVSFDTRTDTVVSAPSALSADPVVEHRQVVTRYLVQVGAFKDAQNATRVQHATRERVQMNVMNDYNSLIGMYQIRVGFFESREAAAAFRDRIVRDFPREYKDSWIVELTQ
jgi:cell division protein FtsN